MEEMKKYNYFLYFLCSNVSLEFNEVSYIYPFKQQSLWRFYIATSNHLNLK